MAYLYCTTSGQSGDTPIQIESFSTAEWDARALLREGGSDDEIADLVRDCIHAKAPEHGINTIEFIRPERAMYQIGG